MAKQNNIHNTENLKDEKHEPHKNKEKEKKGKVVKQVPHEMFIIRHSSYYSYTNVVKSIKSLFSARGTTTKKFTIISAAAYYYRDKRIYIIYTRGI